MAGNHMSELSPRQRMINMMYLVLTALLALNISKEVLDAFQKMDNSIGFSYSEKIEFNEKQYKAFNDKALNNPVKLGQWNQIAKEVKGASGDVVSVIDSVRLKIEELAQRDEDGKLVSLDDKEITIKILVKDENEKGYGYGKLLKMAREEYRNYLLSLDSLGIYEGPDSIYKLNIMSLFQTNDYDEDGPEGRAAPRSWEYQYYGHVPVAAMAFMNQMKLDVGNMEGSVLELIQKKTGQSSITVNSQMPVVSAPRQTIMLGDSFRAQVFVAGVDTNQLPRFNVYAYNLDGERIDSTVIDTLSVDGSKGLFSIKPKKQGTYWLGGDILVQSEEGEKKYEFKQQYRVDEAMSVISPDKMNVLYTIVDNPVSISVPGYSSDELTLQSNFGKCKIKRIKNGTYNINIPEQRGKDRRKEITLTVKANNKIVGKPIVFRIKNVPDPIPMVGGIAGYGEMSKSDIASAWGIVAKMKDFDFDLRYKVVSYTMSYPGAGGQQDMMSKGGQWSPSIQKEFGSIKRGQSIIFRDIKVQIAGAKNMKPRTLPATVTVKIK
tara:strand:+ start:2393 stop:4033 length:1641 start_codon:yes stop_codon:yes gene_type:complete